MALPVFDVFNIFKTVLKFSVFLSFIAFFSSFVPDIANLLKETMDKALESLGLLNGLDLHCVAGLIGLDAFLNSVFNMIFIAGTFYVSGIATILTVKYTVMLFGFAMRI